jgi:hypothetical protein
MDKLKRLSKLLQDAVINSGRPTLVLALVSVMLAATIVFLLRVIFD